MGLKAGLKPGSSHQWVTVSSVGCTTAPFSQPSVMYLPWLICPILSCREVLAKCEWAPLCLTAYVIFPAWMRWESPWDGHVTHYLSQGVQRMEVSPSDFSVAFVPANTMLNNSSVTISLSPILLKEALAPLRARDKEMHLQKQKSRRSWKAAKRCYYCGLKVPSIALTHHNMSPKGEVSPVTRINTHRAKSKLQGRVRAAPLELYWPTELHFMLLSVTNTNWHLESDQTKT